MGSSPISATIGPLVKRLRHRPFTAVTGVRFSHGSPKRKPRQSAWFFRFGDPCLIEKAKCKALCGSSHFASKAMGARSREPRAKIFAKGEILPTFFIQAAGFVCNREAYVITEGGCNRVAHIFSLRLDAIHDYAELHTRLRRITSTLRVIRTRWELAHVSREQKIFEIVEIPIFLKLTPPR